MIKTLAKSLREAGDYLYYFGGIDDAWLGLWGIIRVYRHYNKKLKPICKPKDSIIPLPPCPTKDSVIRKYEVAAIQRKIPYNRYGDHDPDGLIFVPLEDVESGMWGIFRVLKKNMRCKCRNMCRKVLGRKKK